MYKHHGGSVVERLSVVRKVADSIPDRVKPWTLKYVAMFELRLVRRCQNKRTVKFSPWLPHQSQGDSNSEVLSFHGTFVQNKCKAHRQARPPPP